MTTYTKRTNAKRAAIKAGIPDELVEITVHKKGGEVRFGFKKKEAAPAPVPVVTTPAPAPAPVLLSARTTTPREERNGVKRPAPGGLCAAVWEALDQMHAAKVEITAQAVRDLATAKGWNQSNASIEMYQWRKFMGLNTPRVMKEKKPKGAAKAAPPATRVDGSPDPYLA
jgi:hypothetical protein